MRAELDVGVEVLEAMLSSLAESKVRDWRIPRIFAQDHQDHRIVVSHELLSQCESL